MREFEQEAEPTVHQLLRELVEVDWVLVEGFPQADIMKVEVWRREVAARRGDAPVYPEDPFVVAVATDDPDALPLPTLRPVLRLGDTPALLAALTAVGERLEYDPARHD
jgi:molybdopterin-guanine dinucleotide biosynthesis protein B